MTVLNYVILPSSLVVVTDQGAHQVQSDHPNYNLIRIELHHRGTDAVIEDYLEIAASLKKLANGRVEVNEGVVYLDGEVLENDATDYLVDRLSAGDDVEPLANFLVKVNENPSFNSRAQLWGFVKRNGITVTPDGMILLYKGVNDNYTDCHTGTFSNKIGAIHTMARRKVNDDPTVACSYGFHAGAYDYVRDFGTRKMVVEIHPADVVSVPKDANETKVRVTKYEVVAELDASEFQRSAFFSNGVTDLEDYEDDRDPQFYVRVRALDEDGEVVEEIFLVEAGNEQEAQLEVYDMDWDGTEIEYFDQDQVRIVSVTPA